jgi:hypothetical protein
LGEMDCKKTAIAVKQSLGVKLPATWTNKNLATLTTSICYTSEKFHDWTTMWNFSWEDTVIPSLVLTVNHKLPSDIPNERERENIHTHTQEKDPKKRKRSETWPKALITTASRCTRITPYTFQRT